MSNYLLGYKETSTVNFIENDVWMHCEWMNKWYLFVQNTVHCRWYVHNKNENSFFNKIGIQIYGHHGLESKQS